MFSYCAVTSVADCRRTPAIDRAMAGCNDRDRSTHRSPLSPATLPACVLYCIVPPACVVRRAPLLLCMLLALPAGIRFGAPAVTTAAATGETIQRGSAEEPQGGSRALESLPPPPPLRCSAARRDSCEPHGGTGHGLRSRCTGSLCWVFSGWLAEQVCLVCWVRSLNDSRPGG